MVGWCLGDFRHRGGGLGFPGIGVVGGGVGWI